MMTKNRGLRERAVRNAIEVASRRKIASERFLDNHARVLI